MDDQVLDLYGTVALETSHCDAWSRSARAGRDWELTVIDEEHNTRTVVAMSPHAWRVWQAARERYGRDPLLVIGRRPVEGRPGQYGAPEAGVLLSPPDAAPMALFCTHEFDYFSRHGTLFGRPTCHQDGND
jgi:hypothetical protein